MKCLYSFLISLLLLCPTRVMSGDHPYSGFWGEMGVATSNEAPKISGADVCFNQFTQQLPDGRFKFFLVDHENWLAKKSIDYLLAQEGVCTVDEAGRSETCRGGVIGEREQEWFIVYDDDKSEPVRATYYENRFYFEKRFNGVPIERFKCPIDEVFMTRYVSGRSIIDCVGRCRAFGESEASQFFDMVRVIGGGADN